MKILFYLSLSMFVYAYAAFPLLLFLRSLFVRRQRTIGEELPSLTMVIAAHNEVESIGAKLTNLAALDYPQQRLEIIVASDGSDDGTDEVVRQQSHENVRLLALPRRGKIPTLNEAVTQATGEVLVFSDANSMFSSDALRKMVRHFADSQVGAVAGNQVYNKGAVNSASFGERVYWQFDRWLKSLQSRGGNVIAATGAIYAIRRELYRPVPSGVCDDFVISARAIEQGRLVVFEPDARAYEDTAPSDRAEFRRRTRIVTRGLGALWTLRRLFNPFRYGFYSVQIASHKLLRWTSGWVLLAVLLTSLGLYGEGPFFRFIVCAQAICYSLALLVMATPERWRSRWPAPVAIPYYFLLVNLATICAWFNVLRGQKVDLWRSYRDERTAEEAPIS